MADNELARELMNQQCVPEVAIPTATQQDPREIRIFKVLNGFVVFCGCKKVVFENKDNMISEISRYYDNPAKVEKEYLQPKSP
jgi:hypothetical protein